MAPPRSASRRTKPPRLRSSTRRRKRASISWRRYLVVGRDAKKVLGELLILTQINLDDSVLHYTRRARRGGGNWCPIFYSAEARRTRSQFIGDWRVTGNGLPSSLKRGRTKGTNRSPSGRFKGRSIFDPAIGSAGVPPANTVLLVLAQRGVTGANLCPQGELWPLWGYEREGWARRFFENWRASLKWQRLKPYEKFAEMIDRGFGHSIALRTFDRRRSSFETDVTSEAAGVAGDVAAERFAR